MIVRKLESQLRSRLFQGKAIVVIGARQVGKSTLYNLMTQDMDHVLNLNCDDPEVRALLFNINTKELQMLIGNHKIVVVDEAQRTENVGITLKLIIDNFPDVQLLVTGSSSLGLHDQLSEPLTGRVFEYHLYPISSGELLDSHGLLGANQLLESRLIYGSYPDVLNHQQQARELIMNLSGSYLYKDLLSMEGVRRPVLLEKILAALALQVGSEVKYNEIAQLVGSDSKTVEKYIHLLEMCDVVFCLSALNRNVRNELKKGKKIYFWDNGVRNAVIQNFAPLSMRQDVGALWENFFISERMKANHYAGYYAKPYFWRTTAQQEIDFVEEKDGVFTTFEMKWNDKKATRKVPKAFAEAYPIAASYVVTPRNYLEWL
ncbi:MAG: ATP-binding protein [Sodaliphilus sp.]